MTTVTMQSIIYHYAARPQNGLHKGHWFDDNTMAFFDCRLPELAYRTEGGTRAFFVSGERPSQSEPIRYSIRMYDYKTRDISTVGKFQSYLTFHQATKAAQRLAEKSVAA